VSRGVLLVIEDGTEYEEFANAFLVPPFVVTAAHTAAESLTAMSTRPPAALLLDMRFERTPTEDLLGDVEGTAKRLFAGDRERARRHLVDQQGALVLASLREAGCHAPAVFVHDFPARRLENLRKLYGRVGAVPGFDAALILDAFRRLE
jgi:hypothetical protein